MAKAKLPSVLFVSAEAYPYSKETGVADVASSLPISVYESGSDIRVMIPKYGVVPKANASRIHEINRLKNIPVICKDADGKDIDETVTIKSTSLTNGKSKVQVYMATHEEFFESRNGIYHDTVNWEEYPDNLERFIYFCRSVVETCAALGWVPDIIHCNDWHTALVPAYIRYFYSEQFKKTKTILTIHNVSNQGEYPMTKFNLLGLPADAKGSFTHKRHLNILKGGMIYANFVTTVSESYLQQILEETKLTNGLSTLIKQNSNRIVGINNGIANHIWNPKTDNFIPVKYKGDFEHYKTSNKIALCNRCAIKYSPEVPVIGMITNLSHQKGSDLIIEAIPALMRKNLQLIILAQGDPKMREELISLKQKYRGKIHAMFAFDDELAHLLEAGSDMYLMPSRQEACGLNLLYSLAYGTVPIVNLVGGIKDNAIPVVDMQNIGDANCFAMNEFSVKGFKETIGDAVKMFSDKDKWNELVQNGMKGDYSWNNSANEYIEVYKKLCKEE